MTKKFFITLFVILVINFFLPRLMPGDPFDFISVEEGSVTVTLTDEQIEFYRSYYGMDKPVGEQFIDYVKKAITGNFGNSIYYNRPVTDMILERIFWTLSLVISSLIVSSLLGTFLGTLSAYNARGRSHIDDLFLRIMTIISEIPDFIMGIFMLFIFAAKLKWFPLSGGATAFAEYDSILEQIKDYLHHGALPCIVLILSSIGDFFLLARQSMIAILKEPYIETAKAKGLSGGRIMIHHVFINAFSPIVARIFMKLGMLLGGAVLVENIFAYPGVGRLMRESVGLRDYVMIQGIFFYVAIFVMGFNVLADLIYRKTNKGGNNEKI